MLNPFYCYTFSNFSIAWREDTAMTYFSSVEAFRCDMPEAKEMSFTPQRSTMQRPCAKSPVWLNDIRDMLLAREMQNLLKNGLASHRSLQQVQ